MTDETEDNGPRPPRVRQSILAMLLKMESHDPLVYRELLVRGRPGHWRVEVLKGDMCVSNTQAGFLADALAAGLAEDLKECAAPDAPNGAAPTPTNGMLERWKRHVRRVRPIAPPAGADDLFGPLP